MVWAMPQELCNRERLAHCRIVRAYARLQRKSLQLLAAITSQLPRKSGRGDAIDENRHVAVGQQRDQPKPWGAAVDEDHRRRQIPMRCQLLNHEWSEAIVAEQDVAETDHGDSWRCVGHCSHRTLTVAIVRPS